MVRRAVPSPGARALIVISLVGVLGLAARGWEIGGPAVLLVFGPPAVGAGVALWVERASATMLAPAVIAVVGATSVAWGLVTLLGGGLHLLVPALLLLIAAVISSAHRRPDPAATPTRD